MKSLRLKNYRKFDDTGYVDLKPLTMLIGANSSGKSSFLKFFPLLKQTVRRRPNGVFLWFSDDVDFKDFNNTVKEGAEEIDISFVISQKQDASDSAVEVSFSIKGLNERTDYLKKFALKVNDISIEIMLPSKPFYQNGALIDELDIMVNGTSYKFSNCRLFRSHSIFPNIIFDSESSDYSLDVPISAIEYLKRAMGLQGHEYSPSLWNFGRCYSDTSKILGSAKKYYKDFECKDKEEERRIIDEVILFNINRYIESVNYFLEHMADNIAYVQPLRASALRYYRIQNIAVDEIDSHGDNLAMFLYSLGKDQMDDFKEWLKLYFGFCIKIEDNGGHVQIRIIKDDEDKNMVDEGFGYSQMLPILASVWNSKRNRNTRRRILKGSLIYPSNVKYIVIEQPELHLHPRFISMFAEMIASIIKSKQGKSLKFIIETHSETLINRIGELISENDGENNSALSYEDVSIVLFDADKEGFNTDIVQTGYDEEGYLKQWPYGFFSGYVHRN